MVHIGKVIHWAITLVLAVACMTLSIYASTLRTERDSFEKQAIAVTDERNALEGKVQRLEYELDARTGSAPLGARGTYGGWLDTLTNGKDAVVIIAALLSVDGADSTTERLEAFAAALESVEGKTDSKVFKLLNDHVQACKSNPQCGASLGAVLDHLFAKK